MIMFGMSRRDLFRQGGAAAATIKAWAQDRAPDGNTTVPIPRQQWRANVDDLTKRLPGLLSEHHVPGLSIAIIRDSKLAWARGFGVKNAASREAVDLATMFEAGSMSKPPFAYTVMKLCETGVLNLDTPLTTYASEPFLQGDERLNLITTRMVLSHTSGFPNLRSRKTPLQISFTPGERWSYSGEGYYYLQSVVTKLKGRTDAANCGSYETDLRVCGSDFDAYMRSRLLAPFGMRSSGYVWNPAFERHLSLAHNDLGEPLEQRRAKAPDMARYGAMGGLIATPSDYAKFMIEVIAPKRADDVRINASTRAEMLRPQVKADAGKIPSSWALGWQVLHTRFGEFIAHGGDVQGFHAMTFASVSRRSGLIAMTNGDNGWRIIQDHLMQEIGRLV